MPTRKFQVVMAAAMFAGGFATAQAGTVEDARAHFDAIASGDVTRVMAPYQSNARFEWVGGPLNGVYEGAGKIKEVWTKFAKANAPLKVEIGKIDVSGNPAGSTASANVEFVGKNTIKVRYVLVFRDDKISSEVWQIDPKLMVY